VGSNKHQKEASSNHAIFGISKDFADEYQIEVEAYYKDYSNIYSFNQNISADITPELFENGIPIYTETDGVFDRGDGDSKGIEFLLKKPSGAITGWAGYSLSFTDYTVDGVNQERKFAPRHDRTHAINVVANIDWKNLKRSWRGEAPTKHSSNWKIGVTFVYTSGQPITLPGSSYFINPLPDVGVDNFELYPSAINELRLPPYARLDLSLTYEKHFRSWSIFPYIQIFNIGNRKNVWFVDYDTIARSANEPFQPDISTNGMFPILPTIGVNFKF